MRLILRFSQQCGSRFFVFVQLTYYDKKKMRFDKKNRLKVLPIKKKVLSLSYQSHEK